MQIFKTGAHMEIKTLTTPLPIYNLGGSVMVNSGSTLSANSSWTINKYAIDDEGKVYYQVATNEYTTVAGEDVRVVKNLNKKDTTVTIENIDGIKDYQLSIVKDDGSSFSGDRSVFTSGSKWVADKVMLLRGDVYYRIGSNTWFLSGYCNSESKSGVTNVQNDQKHIVTTLTNANVYTSNFVKTGTQEPVNSGWLATKIKNYDGHNYFQIATNMWLIDTQVSETLPYTRIIRISSITPRIVDFQMNPTTTTYDFGQQVVCKSYIESPKFSGYLLEDGKIVSIGDSNATTLMYGSYNN